MRQSTFSDVVMRKCKKIKLFNDILKNLRTREEAGIFFGNISLAKSKSVNNHTINVLEGNTYEAAAIHVMIYWEALFQSTKFVKYN